MKRDVVLVAAAVLISLVLMILLGSSEPRAGDGADLTETVAQLKTSVDRLTQAIEALDIEGLADKVGSLASEVGWLRLSCNAAIDGAFGAGE